MKRLHPSRSMLLRFFAGFGAALVAGLTVPGIAAAQGGSEQGAKVVPAPAVENSPVILNRENQAGLRVLLGELDTKMMAGSSQDLVYRKYQVLRKAMAEGKLLFVVDSDKALPENALLQGISFSPNVQGGASYILVREEVLKAAETRKSLVLSLLFNTLALGEPYFSDSKLYLEHYKNPVESFMYSMDALYLQTLFIRDYLRPYEKSLGAYEEYLLDALEFDHLASVALFVVGVDQALVYGLLELNGELREKKLGEGEYYAQVLRLLEGLKSGLDSASRLAASGSEQTPDDRELLKRNSYIAAISALTMLKYGSRIVATQQKDFPGLQDDRFQKERDGINAGMEALERSLPPFMSELAPYRSGFLKKIGL